MSWPAAHEAVDALDTAGYSDWRLPTVAELASLYDPSLEGTVPSCTKTELRLRVPPEFHLTCALYWSSEEADGLAIQFNFFYGRTQQARPVDDYGFGAYVLAVRNR